MSTRWTRVRAALALGLAILAAGCEPSVPAPESDFDPTTPQAQVEAAAEAGDTAAMRELAARLRDGRGTAADPEAAVQWLERAANAGSAAARRDLGRHYASGLGVPLDEVAAVDAFRAAAEAGDGDAAAMLALAHQEGRGVAKDPDAYLHWLQIAAERQSALGQYHLFTVLEQGVLLPRDGVRAEALLRAAAEQGYTPAQRVLGLGMLGDDPAAALVWLEPASEAGDAEAAFFVGMAYQEGFGTEVDLDRAETHFRAAAETGHRGAQLGLAQLLRQRHPDDPASLHEARSWLDRAARAGHPSAQVELAKMWLEGEGGPKDDATAFDWLHEAAHRGHPEAILQVSYAYAKGRGVEKDPSLAFAWLQTCRCDAFPLAKVFGQELRETLTKEELADARRHARRLGRKLRSARGPGDKGRAPAPEPEVEPGSPGAG